MLFQETKLYQRSHPTGCSEIQRLTSFMFLERVFLIGFFFYGNGFVDWTFASPFFFSIRFQ